MYRGTDQEADVSYAFGYLGDMMIQFIQQHDDTREANGCFTEIHGDPPHILGAFATWRRAHALFKLGDPPIVRRGRD